MATYEIKNATSIHNITISIKQPLIEIMVKKTTYQMIIKLCNTITLKILSMT